MSLPIDRLTAEILELPSSRRAELAHRIIVSLEDEPDEDPVEVENAWAEEIERRLVEYRTGAVKPIPSSEVFAEARALLR